VTLPDASYSYDRSDTVLPVGFPVPSSVSRVVTCFSSAPEASS
jgi:hypothetical protein